MDIYIYEGDGVETIDSMKAKNQTLTASGEYEQYYIYGVAVYLIGGAKGGNDVIFGKNSDAAAQSQIINRLYGDGNNIEFSMGGNDRISGGDYIWKNTIYGDGSQLYGSKGGNDYLAGGSNVEFNNIYGDASLMIGAVDELGKMHSSQGGNDVLISGDNANNNLYGDAQHMHDGIGGNDLLIGGKFGSVSSMYGDAFSMSGASTGGNDRLVSGEGNEDMWGDFCDFSQEIAVFGNDTFVFKNNNGIDTINDFRNGNDKIELSGIAGINNFSCLQIDSINGDSIVTLSTGNSITVTGIATLQAEDFVFS